MDKNIIFSVLFAPVLIFSASSNGAHCDFTKPALVFERACIDDSCREKVRQYLPACENSLRGNLTKTVRHDDGVETAPYLSLAIIGKLTDCIAQADFGRFSKASLDLSQFSDVSKEVRAAKAKNVSGDCAGSNCPGLYIRPIVGQTTFINGPA